MIRIYILILSSMILVAAGCSAPSPTTRPPEAAQDSVARDSNPAPGWFIGEAVAYNDRTIHAYAAAVGSGPADAQAKAISRATALLKQSISGKLEAVRSKGAEEMGGESGLDDAGFLVEIGKAGSAVNEVVTTVQKDTQPVEGQNSSHGFAEVRVQRTELIEQMGKQLSSSNEEAWNALTGSAAFKSF